MANKNLFQSAMSLLRRAEGRNGEPRFSMLETIHEYAREKLRERGEEEAADHRGWVAGALRGTYVAACGAGGDDGEGSCSAAVTGTCG